MFDDIKNYIDPKSLRKHCAYPGCGLQLLTYSTCDACNRYFCRKHRPMFQAQWFCPDCESKYKNFASALKTSNVNEFFKKLS